MNTQQDLYKNNGTDLIFSSDSDSNGSSLTNKLLNGESNGTIIINSNSTNSVENSDSVYAISNAVSIVFIIIVILVIIFWRRYQRNKKKLKKLTKEEVSKFLDGDSPFAEPGIDIESNLPFCIPYNRDFEINLDEIEIDGSCVLGSGAYGLVYRGKMKDQTPIAIKTLKPNADMLYFKTLLSELKVMTFIGQHENIVKCVGACTSELNSRKLYIIVEFCALGSLESYLRDHRDDFKELHNSTNNVPNEYQNVKIETIELEETLQEGKVATSAPGSKYVNVSRNGQPTDKLIVIDLIRFGYEITNAMEYLCSKKVVHGDLASRNILLSEYRKVKLTDFGLSRQMINYSTYVKSTSKQNPLPWRWLAIETMRDFTFSTKSDVWSFGVLLWEIFSLAQVPYPGLTYSQDFLKMLEKGLRMNSPSAFTPPEIYKIMIDTWHAKPEQRPSFSELKEMLLQLGL